MMDVNDVYMDWDLENLEITSKSVEKILEPLIHQLSALVNHKGPSSRKKGQAKQADSLLKSIQDMVEDFLSKGEEIMLDAPERQKEFRTALQDVERSGKNLCQISKVFMIDSCNMEKRNEMMNAMKAMLSSVTRLMILADIMDTYISLKATNRVLADLNMVKDSTDLQKIANNWKTFSTSASELIDLVGIRQKDLIDDRKKMQMAAARGILRTHIPIVLTTIKNAISHPELSSAGANRDYAVKCITDALDLITTAIEGTGNKKALFYEIPGETASVLDSFEKHAVIKVEKYTDMEGVNMTAKLERIVSDCAVLVSSPCTRENHKKAIVAEGKNAMKNVKSLSKVYQTCTINGMGTTNELREAQSKMLKSTEQLIFNLKAAVADHIIDTFLDTKDTLKMLINAAKSGNEDSFESVAPYFLDTIAKIVEVAKLSCSVSLNYDGVKLVRLAANQLETICPELINAARVVVLRPASTVALENLTVFRSTFSNRLNLLSEAVDNITDIHGYLSVVDAHIAEDIKQCAIAGQSGSYDDFEQNVIVLRDKVLRACATVHSEMEGFRKSGYRNRVEDCLRELEKQHIPNFDKFAATCLDNLKKGVKLDENSIADEFGEVYDGIHEVWKAVVLGRDESGYETDRRDSVDRGQDSTSNQEDQVWQFPKPKSLRSVINVKDEPQSLAIDESMAGFLEQRKRLIHETTKWDESGNEIVLISKKMGALIVDVMDFARGVGPLKLASDVIEILGKVLEYGTELNAVLSKVIKGCPSSTHKSDLERCMERVSLYCHQLKITSSVTSGVRAAVGVTSEVDAVLALIENSRNLMAAVVETVKAGYVATTKYKGENREVGIQWRMKAPTKKPLYHGNKNKDLNLKVSAEGRNIDPMDELNQFRY